MVERSSSRRDRVDELYVPIDVSKYFHRTMICAPRGKIIRNQFEIDVYSEGIEKLLSEVEKLLKERGLKGICGPKKSLKVVEHAKRATNLIVSVYRIEVSQSAWANKYKYPILITVSIENAPAYA